MRFSTINILLILFYSLVGPTELRAYEIKMAILPFSIKGNISKSGLPEQNLAERLQQASAYLLKSQREIKLQDPSVVKQEIAQSTYKAELPFDSANLRKYCRNSTAAYLLTGSFYFSGSKNNYQLSTWSCRLGRKLGQSTVSGNSIELQKNLKYALKMSTPFLNPHNTRNPELPSSYAKKAIDLAVIIDTSGSMSYDLSAIQKALISIGHSQPKGSRLGLIILKEHDELDIIPFTKNWQRNIRHIRKSPTAGESTLKGLQNALGIIARNDNWIGKKALAIFTDVSLGAKRQSQLESSLRQIKARGIQTWLFPVLNQSWSDLHEWQRIARTLSFVAPKVQYARKLYPLGKQPYYIFTTNNRYYTTIATNNLTHKIKHGVVDLDLMSGIPTASWSRKQLNLIALSKAWPKRKRQRISKMLPIVSNLEKVIVKSINNGGKSKKSMNRVLLKNGKYSFWIDVKDRNTLRMMQNKSEFFIGMHFSASSGKGTIVALPAPIEIHNYNTVPLLFLTTWKKLHQASISSINPNDIWFMKVKFIEKAR